jgi:hypothetical protein
VTELATPGIDVAAAEPNMNSLELVSVSATAENDRPSSSPKYVVYAICHDPTYVESQKKSSTPGVGHLMLLQYG